MIDPVELASRFGLPEDHFTTGNLSEAYTSLLKSHFEAAQKSKIRGTPSLFVNGVWLPVADRKCIETAVKAILKPEMDD